MPQLLALLLVLGGWFLSSPSATEVYLRGIAGAIGTSDPNGAPQADARSTSDPDGATHADAGSNNDPNGAQTDAISTSDPNG